MKLLKGYEELAGPYFPAFELNEYGYIIRISLYSVQMRENTDQKNSEYGHDWLQT